MKLEIRYCFTIYAEASYYMLSFFKMTNWQTELTTIRKTLHNKGKTGEK
ncbi:hypothetical protein BACI9J_130031 [Bacillus altitudinis]|nr:hypothetical protein [Bacillus altitudinis]VXB08308.1 hypothetical protein BACI9J_130031 [Bacillus altitudinis]